MQARLGAAIEFRALQPVARVEVVDFAAARIQHDGRSFGFRPPVAAGRHNQLIQEGLHRSLLQTGVQRQH